MDVMEGAVRRKNFSKTDLVNSAVDIVAAPTVWIVIALHW